MSRSISSPSSRSICSGALGLIFLLLILWPLTTNTSLRYFFTFGTGALDDPDFIIWGSARSTSCGLGCTYDQNIVPAGNPGGALTLAITGTQAQGGAGPRQNGVSLSTATDFEYSADFYIANGQLDARYGLVFNASSSTFPGSGDPPFAPQYNFYVLEMRLDTITRTQVAKWQIKRVVNGAVESITPAADLLFPITQGQWHNLKVHQQGASLSVFLNGILLGSTTYDSAWGDARRRFGIYVDVRNSNGVGGPFEIFADNIAVADMNVPPDMTLDGPVVGTAAATYTFTAAMTLITATTPITYVWQATEQSLVIHASEQITDAMSFGWDAVGTKTITVTAMNADGVFTATHDIAIQTAPAAIQLNGPLTGVTEATYAFTAATTPVTVTVPITYLWQATDQSPIVHVSDQVTDSAAFTWAMSGTKTITVTALNDSGSVTAAHLLEVAVTWKVFLPAVMK